jgi:hypothetical protein
MAQKENKNFYERKSTLKSLRRIHCISMHHSLALANHTVYVQRNIVLVWFFINVLSIFFY